MSRSNMLLFAVVVVSVFIVDGSRNHLRSSQTLIHDARPYQATLVQQPAMFAAELPKGPVEFHGLAGNSGTYPEEVTTVMEAQPPSAETSSHEDETDDVDAGPLTSITDGSGPEPPSPEATTQAKDWSGSSDYDKDDADAGDATDYLQGTPSNHSEALTMYDEEETGVTPAPPAPDADAQQIDLPFVVYPGWAKVEKERLEKKKLAAQKREQEKKGGVLEKPEEQGQLENSTKQPVHVQNTTQFQNMRQPHQANPLLVKSQIAMHTDHTTKGVKATAHAGKKQMPVDQPGWGQPVGILRPRGWEQCIKFSKYVKDEGYKGVSLVRVWKSLCEPSVLSGSATERYRLMCNSLGRTVEPYARMGIREYRDEDICDSVLATFHDISAVDMPFDR